MIPGQERDPDDEFATCICLGMWRPRLGELGVYKKHIELKMIVFVFWLASVVAGVVI